MRKKLLSCSVQKCRGVFQVHIGYAVVAERFLKLEKDIDELDVPASGLSMPGRFVTYLLASALTDVLCVADF